DRWRAYAGELLELEAWLLNDTPDDYQGLKLVATLRNETEDYASFELEADIGSVNSAYVGSVPFVMPTVDGRRTLQADISLFNRSGELVNSERFDIEVFPNNLKLADGEPEPAAAVHAAAIGTAAEALLAAMGLPCRTYEAGLPFDVIFLSSAEAFRLHETEIAGRIEAGARAIIVPDEGGEAEWRIGDIAVRQEKTGSLYTLAFDEADVRLELFGSSDFQFFYNQTLDRIDALTGCGWHSESMSPLLYAYAKPKGGTRSGGAPKRRVPVVGSVRYGRGELLFVGLRLEGRLGCNPPLDLLLQELIVGRGQGRGELTIREGGGGV
ncbi:MAG: Beta-galactosidase, partial [Paenibacillus sp.]|nr:Beta-galactosidase [Paenibacillus sp.]